MPHVRLIKTYDSLEHEMVQSHRFRAGSQHGGRQAQVHDNSRGGENAVQFVPYAKAYSIEVKLEPHLKAYVSAYQSV
eukprot:622163-Pelagomonas_calceolata.AAC.4